jgi:serine/threonine protein kinase
MSPEQARARGRPAHPDIWAFGCVVDEMVTGRVALAGETVSDTIARLLEHEPDGTVLRHDPASIRRPPLRCLTKDPRRRLRDMEMCASDRRDRRCRRDRAGDRTDSARYDLVPWVIVASLALASAPGQPSPGYRG